ncbi:FlgM protein [Helicobacter sp. NHP21005]|uniref:flagellar biosynthesis anti-sigma factor FlgM n=1 Tax=Helicobacter felistomachi TaxID=3040201 RepID=UPI003EBB6FDD|nr:FlgM protein [Helicobacter sp. NHP21005]
MLKPIGTAPSYSHLSPVQVSRPTSHAQASEAHESDRVAQIKKAVENGHYKVDMDKTAHKMAQDLLG